MIQASYTRALDRGLQARRHLRLRRCCRRCGVRERYAAGRHGLVQPGHRRGPEAFLDQAQAAGFSGAIVPDLPFEESESSGRLAADRDFKLIHLVTPTTPRERAVRIARVRRGFSTASASPASPASATGCRRNCSINWPGCGNRPTLPLCVGFGISKPEHVRMLRDVADGVIVGSAIVRQLEQAASSRSTRQLGHRRQPCASRPGLRSARIPQLEAIPWPEKKKRRQIEREFGVPIAGEILDPVAVDADRPEETAGRGAARLADAFGRSAPLVVDLGCGNGRFLLGSAVWRPRSRSSRHRHPAGRHPLCHAPGNQRGLTNIRFAVVDGRAPARAAICRRAASRRSIATIRSPIYEPRRSICGSSRRSFCPGASHAGARRPVLHSDGQSRLLALHPRAWCRCSSTSTTHRPLAGRAQGPDAARDHRLASRPAGLPRLRERREAGPECSGARALAEALPPPVFDADRRLRELDECEKKI